MRRLGVAARTYHRRIIRTPGGEQVGRQRRKRDRGPNWSETSVK